MCKYLLDTPDFHIPSSLRCDLFALRACALVVPPPYLARWRKVGVAKVCHGKQSPCGPRLQPWSACSQVVSRAHQRQGAGDQRVALSSANTPPPRLPTATSPCKGQKVERKAADVLGLPPPTLTRAPPPLLCHSLLQIHPHDQGAAIPRVDLGPLEAQAHQTTGTGCLPTAFSNHHRFHLNALPPRGHTHSPGAQHKSTFKRAPAYTHERTHAHATHTHTPLKLSPPLALRR